MLIHLRLRADSCMWDYRDCFGNDLHSTSLDQPCLQVLLNFSLCHSLPTYTNTSAFWKGPDWIKIERTSLVGVIERVRDDGKLESIQSFVHVDMDAGYNKPLFYSMTVLNVKTCKYNKMQILYTAQWKKIDPRFLCLFQSIVQSSCVSWCCTKSLWHKVILPTTGQTSSFS